MELEAWREKCAKHRAKIVQKVPWLVQGETDRAIAVAKLERAVSARKAISHLGKTYRHHTEQMDMAMRWLRDA